MIEIKPIQPNQVEAVKGVIVAVCREIFQVSEEVVKRYDPLSDIDEVQAHYGNNGIFLVVSNSGRVVGSGAIRRLSDDICELKRMWLLAEYRGRGLGIKMARMLLSFADQTGYKKVRLDLVDAQRQAQALKLYQRLGFYLIQRYNDGPGTVFMEKRL